MTGLVRVILFGFLLLLPLRIAASPGESGTSHFPRESCTTVMLSKDGQVILGDNEDAGSDHPLCADPCGATIWIFPPGSERGGRYGCVWIGWAHGDGMSGQAGMNGIGLAFGLTAVPHVELEKHPERPYTPQTHGGLYYRILWECATVSEAVQTALHYNLDSLSYQMLVADASGDAAIIGPGHEGQIAVTRKEIDKCHLVASTFNVITGQSIGQRDAQIRWTAAKQSLQGENSQNRSALTLVQSALEASHRERPPLFGAYTMYSVMFDITGLKVHLTFLSDFSHDASLDLEKEMADAPIVYRLCDLVPPAAREAALKSFRATRRKGAAAIAGAAFAVVIVVIAAFIWLISRARKSKPR